MYINNMERIFVHKLIIVIYEYKINIYHNIYNIIIYECIPQCHGLHGRNAAVNPSGSKEVSADGARGGSDRDGSGNGSVKDTGQCSPPNARWPPCSDLWKALAA